MKVAFLVGSFLIAFPILLRVDDLVDNSAAFMFMVLGILTVVIADRSRARPSESIDY